KVPSARPPRLLSFRLRDRKHMTDDLVDAIGEEAPESFTLERVRELRVEDVDVDRQLSLAPEVVVDVLVCPEDTRRIDAEPFGNAREETAGELGICSTRGCLVRDQSRILPERLPITTPVQIE